VFAHQDAIDVTKVELDFNTSSINVTSLYSDEDQQTEAVKVQAHCMNTDRTDFWGRQQPQVAAIPAGQVLPLWMAMQIPTSSSSFNISGVVTITVGTAGTKMRVPVEIVVSGPPIADGGDSEEWRGTRLQWLDSDLAVAGDTVPPPYEAINVTHGQELVVDMLDKQVAVGADGMLSSVKVGTSAKSDNDPTGATVELLAAPVDFGIFVGGQRIMFDPGAFKLLSSSNMSTAWSSLATATTATTGAAAGMLMAVNGSIDCTGFADYVVTLTSPGGGGVDGLAVNMSVPSTPTNSHMAMGLGLMGGYIENVMAAAAQKHKHGEELEWLVFDFGKAITAGKFSRFQVLSISCLFSLTNTCTYSHMAARLPHIVTWLLSYHIQSHGCSLTTYSHLAALLPLSITADALGLYTSADGVHDPTLMRLWSSNSATGGHPSSGTQGMPTSWKPVGAPLMGKSSVSGRQVLPFTSAAGTATSMNVSARYWKLEIVSRQPSSGCKPQKSCQGWIAEIQVVTVHTQRAVRLCILLPARRILVLILCRSALCINHIRSFVTLPPASGSSTMVCSICRRVYEHTYRPIYLCSYTLRQVLARTTS
jgi:hypothetical protein